MSDNETVVRDFIVAWSQGDARKLADFFTDDAVVWNDGRTTVRGRDAIHEHFTMQLSACTDCDFEITQTAVTGSTVFNERIDRMKIVGVPVELPVAGVFELDDAGKLTAWRDYFDLSMLMTQLNAAGVGGDPNGPGS
ncbi:MAG TPA: SgcJ/EcaC family oxidoreductase [Actinomycetota bacterium]|nr:SgcJ/EcaC family oxidoreductase [Actinomycetota bacterium]